MLIIELPSDILYSICDFLSLSSLIMLELTSKILYEIASDPIHIKSFALFDSFTVTLFTPNKPVPLKQKTDGQLLCIYLQHYIKSIKDKTKMREFRLSKLKELHVFGGSGMNEAKYLYPKLKFLEKITIATNGFEDFKYFQELNELKRLLIHSMPCNYKPLIFMKLKIKNLQKLIQLELNEININNNSDINILSKLINLQELQIGKFIFDSNIDMESFKNCILNWKYLKKLKLFEWNANQFTVTSGYDGHPFNCILLEKCIENNPNLEVLQLFMPPKTDQFKYMDKWQKIKKYHDDKIYYKKCEYNINQKTGITMFPSYKIWENNKGNMYKLKVFECILCGSCINYQYYIEIFNYLRFVNNLEHIKISWNYFDDDGEITDVSFAELLSNGFVALLHEETDDDIAGLYDDDGDNINDNTVMNEEKNEENDENAENEEMDIWTYGDFELYHFPRPIIRYLLSKKFWNFKCMKQLKQYQDEGFILNNLILTMEEDIVCDDYMEIREKGYVDNICITKPMYASTKIYNEVKKMFDNGFDFKVYQQPKNGKILKYNSIPCVVDRKALKEWKQMNQEMNDSS